MEAPRVGATIGSQGADAEVVGSDGSIGRGRGPHPRLGRIAKDEVALFENRNAT